MLTNREVILAKIEVTYNTDPVPTAGTDAILVEEPAWANEGLRMNERPAIKANLAPFKPVYGGRLKTISFTAEVKGSGAAGTAPELSPLFRACGLGETIVASTSVTYEPVSTGHESCTIYYYRDGKQFILTGCRGNVSFTLEAGGICKAAFTMTGHVNTDADVAMVSPTYDTAIPPAMLNGAFTIDSYAAVISALNFDLANTLSMSPDISATDGYGEIYITKHGVTGSIDPEEELVADEDFIGNFTSGAAMALATGTFGAAGNQFGITMPAVTYTEVAPGDRDGLRTLDLTFMAADSAGDDSVSILFT